MIDHNHSHTSENRSWVGILFQALFVVLALVLLVTQHDQNWFPTFALIFVAIVLEALPFMLLGSLVGGVIDVFVPPNWIAAFLPEKRKSTIFIAAALGMIFPVCECAVVPVVRRLVQKGVPLSAAVAYLLAGPIFNPIVGASTAVAYGFDWSVVFTRLGTGYVVAITAGILIGLFFNRKTAYIDEISSARRLKMTMDLQVQRPPLNHRIAQTARVSADDFFELTRFLIIGAFIAALMQTVVNRQLLTELVAHSETLSVLFMMLLAIALNLCSEADAFVAASFQSSPISLTAQMAFMVLGPMLDIKLLLMYLRLFRKRLIIVLAITVFTLVFLAIMAGGALGI